MQGDITVLLTHDENRRPHADLRDLYETFSDIEGIINVVLDWGSGPPFPVFTLTTRELDVKVVAWIAEKVRTTDGVFDVR